MNKKLEVLKEVKRRKITYLGHIMRGSKYEILNLILEEEQWLREWFNMSSVDLFRAAISKIRIVTMLANLL